MIRNLLLVGLGGATGSILRYCVQKLLPLSSTSPFPVGTLIVNISGCFLIGLLWGLAFRSQTFSQSFQIFLMTGLCGGYTTFSAFTMESIGLLRENKTGLFFLYAALSVLIGLAATWVGFRISR